MNYTRKELEHAYYELENAHMDLRKESNQQVSTISELHGEINRLKKLLVEVAVALTREA
jgi:hypothetical protein